jgi:glycine/D-amino acid oxidase-like deaminating enzyme
VQLEGQPVLPADAVLIALGPWTGQAAAWLPSLPAVGGQKAHSVVLRPAGGGNVDATAAFTVFRDAGGQTREPEIYPRPDGTVYVGRPSASPAGAGATGGPPPALRGRLARPPSMPLSMGRGAPSRQNAPSPHPHGMPPRLPF